MTSVHMASIPDRFFLLLVPLWSRGFSSVGTGGWTESEVVVEEEIIKAVFEVGRRFKFTDQRMNLWEMHKLPIKAASSICH